MLRAWTHSVRAPSMTLPGMMALQLTPFFASALAATLIRYSMPALPCPLSSSAGPSWWFR